MTEYIPISKPKMVELFDAVDAGNALMEVDTETITVSSHWLDRFKSAANAVLQEYAKNSVITIDLRGYEFDGIDMTSISLPPSEEE